MSKLAPDDERLLQRFADGELPEPAAAALRRRLEAEPSLRRQLQELQALRAWFRAPAAPAVAVSAGFTAGLLATIRQRTLNQDWRQGEPDPAPALRLCRRLLLAAAVLIALCALWHAGLLRSLARPPLEASADELRQLDDQIRAEAMAAPPAAETRK